MRSRFDFLKRKVLAWHYVGIFHSYNLLCICLQAFVSCAVGTGSVGFVMMTYGLADAIGCVLTGYVAKVWNKNIF